jgi:hypothetical protein
MSWRSRYKYVNGPYILWLIHSKQVKNYEEMRQHFLSRGIPDTVQFKQY